MKVLTNTQIPVATWYGKNKKKKSKNPSMTNFMVCSKVDTRPTLVSS
jgi:hypothetical protein